MSIEMREKLLSCGNRCIKDVREPQLQSQHRIVLIVEFIDFLSFCHFQFPCGHRCTNICHSGKCQNEESCRKKIKVYCSCKHRKVDTGCDKIRAGFELACDETCVAYNTEARRIAAEIERTKQEQEDERNRMELEKFEKKFTKKRHKERKERSTEAKDNTYAVKIAAAAAAVAILAGLIFYLF